ncbi:WD40 repeat domain-containing serine/threonine protein kinase [Nocardiopsis sp. N85]|uniref:WD40 repeat domain-containing serine/threonine protein kinase n=1 Tax=Nocardiopsis sp. N85 TaxID=3029400 RepID=UPI00237F394F|nr:WD40 repeat domain-containing serine/threonine protein kinase [Nocardiopsis sp. N85]MDE3723067.1 WD40 repeat domain-containing serine/threonine protein kinase [Nocardiopsis sp. N85]
MRPLTPDEPDRLGGFRLIAHLGSGDLGDVYLGVDPEGRPAAVRAVRLEYASDHAFRTGFTREADGTTRARGRFIPPLLGHDLAAERPWLATGFVAGPRLRDMVGRGGPLPGPALRLLARGLAEALDHMHTQGCVHRDLSPTTVLVDATGPKLIGLGIGRALEGSPVGRGRSTRPPAYTAPEYLAGRAVLPEGDLFSLGAVLLFAGTGRAPFGEGRSAEVTARVLREPPDLSGVPEELRDTIAACLDKLPENRPSAARLLEELGGPLPDEPPAPSWLPPRSRETVIRAEEAYRSVAAPTLGPLPPPGFDPFPVTIRATGPRPHGRALLRVCALVFVLLLFAVLGVYSLSGAEREASGTAASTCSPHNGPSETLPPPEAPEASFSPDTLVELAFSLDGATLAVTTGDGTTLWNWRSSSAVAHVPNEAAPLPPAPAAFSPNGCLIAQASLHGALVTDLSTGRSWTIASGRTIRSVAFSPNGAELALAIDNDPDRRFLHLYDTETWKPTTALAGSGSLGAVRYTLDGRTVAGGESGGGVATWRTPGGARIGLVRDRNGAGAGAFDVVTGNGGVLVIRGDRVLLMNPTMDREVRAFVPADDHGVPVDVVHSPSSGRVLAARLAPQTDAAFLSIWDFETGEPVRTPWSPPALFPIAISPDGSRLAGVRPETGDIAVYDMGMTLMGILSE